MKEIARRLVAARIESAGVEIRRMIDVDRLVAEIEAALTDAAATARADGERDMRERVAKCARDEANEYMTQANASFEERDQGSAILWRERGEALLEFAAAIRFITEGEGQ